MNRQVLIKLWIPHQYSEWKDGKREVITGTGCFTKMNIPGNFHAWGLEIVEHENTSSSYSIALVELSDGTITKVLPEDVKFI